MEKINWSKVCVDPVFVGYDNDGFVNDVLTYFFKA